MHGALPSADALDGLLYELDISLPGQAEYELVSEWAAKHVWKVSVEGHPWAFVRYLLGPASLYPARWRHFTLSLELFEEGIGPQVLGLSAQSEALDGRAAIVEAALQPIPRAAIGDYAPEAVALLGRLHGSVPVYAALARSLTNADLMGISPVSELLQETRERWFSAVFERWLSCGFGEISLLAEIVSTLFNRLESMARDETAADIVVPAHNDPNFGNFMLNDAGELRLIDFDELAFSNPVADLGMFLTWYTDRHEHLALLQNYPLAQPESLLRRMQSWVPLRYLGIAAHWAARLTRARDRESWEFACYALDEWLRACSALLYEDRLSARLDGLFSKMLEALLQKPGMGQ